MFVQAERRRLELKRIRCAYMPELVFRLHTALMLSGEDFVPRYVRCQTQAGLDQSLTPFVS